MAALAFLYQGLTRFTLGESILVDRMHLRTSVMVFPARSRPEQVPLDIMAKSYFLVAQYWSMIDSIQEERSHVGLLRSTIISSQIHVCLRQAIQVAGTFLLHLLSARAMCSAIFAETTIYRGSATIRGYGRVRPHIRTMVWGISFSPAMAEIPLLLSNSSLVLMYLLTIMNGGKLFVLHHFVKINKIMFSSIKFSSFYYGLTTSPR